MENFTTTHTISRATVEDRLANGYSFDIGNYISQGFEIFKKEWLTFSLYGLIVLAIVMTGIGALFTYPLILGFFRGAEKVHNGENLSIGDMFDGFSKDLSQLIILMLIPIGVMLIIYLPFMATIFASGEMSQYSEAAGFASLGLMLLFYVIIFVAAMVLTLAMFFAPYLVYYGDYKPIEALKTSWKLSMKNPLLIIVYGLLIGFITQLGMLLCFVGVFATMAFAYVCYYPLMKEILFKEKVNVQP